MQYLSAAIVDGRLTLPIGRVALDRVGLPTDSSIRDECDTLYAAGFSHLQIAQLINAIAEERARCELLSVSIEVVATGPSGGVMTRDTSIVLEELFITARSRILVVGFALHGGQAILKTLATRLDNEPNLEATLCLDISRQGSDSTRDGDIVDRFADRFVRKEWPGKRLPSIYYDPRGLRMNPQDRAVLHAKVAIVDGSRGLVTSANLTAAAQKRNIELGLHFVNDHIARAIEGHFQGLIQSRALIQVIFATSHR